MLNCSVLINYIMWLFKKIHFEISERKMMLRVLDVSFIFLALYISDIFFMLNYNVISASNYYWSLILAIYLNIFGTIFEMYNLEIIKNQLQVLKSTLLTVSFTVLIYLLTPVLSPHLPANRYQILLFFLILFLSLFTWRVFYINFFTSTRFVQKVILVCNQDHIQELILGLENSDPHYRVVGFVNMNNNNNNKEADKKYNLIRQIELDQLINFTTENDISEIVVASQNADRMTVDLYERLLQLLQLGNTLREYTQVYESKNHRIPVQYMSKDFNCFFPFSRNNQNKSYLIITRILEILFSILGVLITLILIPIIIIANSIANKGPLFYSQQRVGKDGNVFEILKFRTMINNAEYNGAVCTIINDARVTQFGKFMRKTRIDEFPQFINILKGDMAVIGPRPERPEFVSKLAETMPFYQTRHIIRPGITGWAQVNYSYGGKIEDSLIKLQYDLYYIKHRNIYLDLDIAIKTITTVIFYRGQ